MSVDFSFETTEESYALCLRIREALMLFFDLSEADAVSKINAYWSDTSRIDDDPILFEEPPYYYAMCIGHHPVLGDGVTEWWRDSDLWPPPDDWRY